MERNNASFRDEGGYVFHHEGLVYRCVDASFRAHYDHFMSSGLYQALVDRGLLLRHEEVDPAAFPLRGAYKVLRPEQVRFLSYPYEWSFHQMKDAALATLAIQRLALEHGMVLKDASSYNIQFTGGKPRFIDTLSFLKLGDKLEPWIAYKQFCEHFLVPLALMSYYDRRMNLLVRSFIDGIPIEIGAGLLPARSRFSPGLLVHIHLHAKFHRRHAGRVSVKPARPVSRYSLLGMTAGLARAVRRLEPPKEKTAWIDYYQDDNNQEYVRSKKGIVEDLLGKVKPALVWDIGANTGEYSRLCSARSIDVVSLDIDPQCVDANYLAANREGDDHLHPMLLNIMDPSPGLGWANRERQPFLTRTKPDLIMAFAVIHHLAITHNIPFELTAALWSATARFLIIEFLETADARVQDLLSFKKGGDRLYSRTRFEEVFSAHYRIVECRPTANKSRILYLMESLQPA